jgi:hypothetical protein
MVVSLTTSKFMPLIFSLSGFTLSYTANMFILMIPYDFCLFPAQFCYIIVYIRKVKSCVQIADRRVCLLPVLCPLLITYRHRPHRKRHSSTVAFLSAAARTSSPCRFLETAAAWTTENTVFLLLHACMLRALPSNYRCLQSHHLATALYTT